MMKRSKHTGLWSICLNFRTSLSLKNILLWVFCIDGLCSKSFVCSAPDWRHLGPFVELYMIRLLSKHVLCLVSINRIAYCLDLLFAIFFVRSEFSVNFLFLVVCLFFCCFFSRIYLWTLGTQSYVYISLASSFAYGELFMCKVPSQRPSSVRRYFWSFERKSYTWWSPKSSHSWFHEIRQISGEIHWITYGFHEIWWISGEICQISCRFHVKSTGNPHEIHRISKDQLPGMVSPMFYNSMKEVLSNRLPLRKTFWM